MNVVGLSALRTGRLYLNTHFYQTMSDAERITSMKNFNDPFGNLTRDLPACSIVPLPTAHPATPTLPRKLLYTDTTKECLDQDDNSHNDCSEETLK
jgi:hypothetical protein